MDNKDLLDHNNQDYLLSDKSAAEKEREEAIEAYRKSVLKSFAQSFKSDCSDKALEWLDIQCKAQIPQGGDYSYSVGYQNCIKDILGMINSKET